MTYSSKDEHKSEHNLTELNCQSFSQFLHPEYGYSPLKWEASPSHANRPPPWQQFFMFSRSLVCIHFYS